MSGTVITPTQSIVEASSLIEEGIGRFLDARKTLPNLGKYESDVAALDLFYLVIRHVEAMCTLANRDLVMLPSALAIGRAAFESTGQILWMLHPTEVFDREARYLAYLWTEEDFYRRVTVMAEEFGEDAEKWSQEEERFRDFRKKVEQLLPPTIKPFKALPKFREILKAIGEEKRYGNYMRLSQFAHGTHAAGGLYRKNLGYGKVAGEFIYPESWAEPLKCAWWCLAKGGTTILQQLGGNPEEFLDHGFLQKITEALSKV